MAKSKKSKILAMALCASVMTGIYASPVMAAAIELESPSTVKVGAAEYEVVSGTLNLDGEDIAGALNGTNLTLDSVTANTIITSGTLTANGAADLKGGLKVTGDTTLEKTTVNGTLTAGATTVGSLEVTGGKFTVDADGNTTVGGTLNVTDKLTANNGLKVTNGTETDTLNVTGAATVDSLEVAKGIEAANGKFELTKEGVLTVNGKAYFTEGATVQNGLTVTGDSSVAGNFTVTNGGLSVSGGESVLNGGLTVNNGDTKLNGKLDVGAGNFKVDTAGNTEFNGNLNIGHDAFEVTAADGSFSAARENFKVSADGVINADSLYLQTYGSGTLEVGEALQALTDAKLPDKVGGIEREPEGAGDPGNGTTTIEGMAKFDSEGMTVGETVVNDGKITVGAEDAQTIIEGGAITAKSLLLDGKNVGETIFGIERVGDVTTIEGATSFDANGMSIKNLEGFGTSLGVAGMEITAAGDFKTSFTAGGATFVGASGTTTINGGAIQTTTINGVNFTQWHDEVDGRLDGLEEKTQNIKPGTGAGTGTGEGGTAAGESNNIIEVPATEDGHTGINGNVTVGGEINAGAGNIGGVGMEEGTITAGDGNFTGDVDITGDINAGTGNIGGVEMNDNRVTADSGNIGGVEMNDNTVTADKGAFKDVTVDNSVTVAGGSENKTTINNDGITVGDKGTSIKNDSISVGDGGYIGGGDVVSGEGVSLNQTAERVGHLENRVGELEDRVDKVGAMAAAIANLRTMGYDPAAPTEVAVGIGQYRDETGAALGLFHYPNRDFMLSLSVSTSGDEVMGGIGATWKFGRKSPEKVAEIKKAQAEADARRAEEAKLAKAEAMKKAAKEAKIKAQQERHAKLAAERAAQAEAAK